MGSIIRRLRTNGLALAYWQPLRAAPRFLFNLLISTGPLFFCFLGAVCLTYAFQMAPAMAEKFATEQGAYPVITVSSDQRISGCIADQPLDEVLLIMSGKDLFAIKGALPIDQTVSVTFVDVTLDAALRKLLRGYNYVLINEEANARPFLMMMGKVVRPRPTGRGVPRRAFARLPATRVAGPATPMQQQRVTAIPRSTSPSGRLFSLNARTAPLTSRTQKGFQASAIDGGGQQRPASTAPTANVGTEGIPKAKGAEDQQSVQAGFPSTPGNTGVKF